LSSTQKSREDLESNSLADFIDEKEDYIGAFAVTAGHGIDEHIERFESELDDYNAIILKALADRFAEAFAEWAHKKVRCEFWGYSAEENFDNDEADKREISGHSTSSRLSVMSRSPLKTKYLGIVGC
jgi:5-methyltetrahydrofolate--homocysteine methyltransferase